MIDRRKLFLAIILSGIVIFLAVLTVQKYAPPKSDLAYQKQSNPQPTSSFQPINKKELQEKKDRWTVTIKKDPHQAYEDFKKEMNKSFVDRQHAYSHVFGELLYKIRGLDGISVCDTTFNYGCLHGFFGEAVSLDGLSIISRLDHACANTDEGGACQHGIGHAILAYYGKNERIYEALNFCSKLKSYGPFGGCANGVFMEYNFFTMRSEKDVPRESDNKNIHEPCTLVTEKYRPGCYFFQPQWWRHVFKSDYKKIGRLCAGLSNQKQKKSCFIGIGNVIGPSMHFDIHKSVQKCTLMPSLKDQVNCRIGLFSIFSSEPEYKKFVEIVCDGLPNPEKKVCLEHNQF